MSKKDEVTKEELNKIIQDAGSPTNAIKDGRPGLSIANEALAKILVTQYEASKSMLESSKRLELYTGFLIIITVVDIALKLLGK
jgi:hypothetical protein